MARHKPYDLDQGQFLAVSFRDQILPGSFEHALNEIVEEHLDLTAFEDRYENDETGRLAYDPAVLLKIVPRGQIKVSANINGHCDPTPRLHKVDTQWKLYALVHNIEKIAHYGTG